MEPHCNLGQLRQRSCSWPRFGDWWKWACWSELGRWLCKELWRILSDGSRHILGLEQEQTEFDVQTGSKMLKMVPTRIASKDRLSTDKWDEFLVLDRNFENVPLVKSKSETEPLNWNFAFENTLDCVQGRRNRSSWYCSWNWEAQLGTKLCHSDGQVWPYRRRQTSSRMATGWRFDCRPWKLVRAHSPRSHRLMSPDFNHQVFMKLERIQKAYLFLYRDWTRRARILILKRQIWHHTSSKDTN